MEFLGKKILTTEGTEIHRGYSIDVEKIKSCYHAKKTLTYLK